MEIVKVATEVDEAGPHHLVQAGWDDGGGGVVTEPDSGVRLMGRLGGGETDQL